MTLVITGGCGFAGSNIAAGALQRGLLPVVFDNLSREGSRDNLAWLRALGDVKFVHGDIRSSDDVDSLIKTTRPDALFHLAGQVAMTTSISRPRFDFEVNALGTLNVAEAVRRHSPNCAVLYSSTNKVYGDLEMLEYVETDSRYTCPSHPLGFGEALPLDFRSPYGCSKGCADQYLLDYHRMYGLRTVVFRHSSMYGGRQFATEDQGWVGWFCAKAVKMRREGDEDGLLISGDGKQVRDLLFADDVVDLYFTALDAIDRAQGQAFNIGGGVRNSMSLVELFGYLESYVGRPISYRCQPWRQSDQRVFVANTNKARDLLGWAPSTAKEDGLASTLEWLETRQPGADRE
jgi:CDP-paratose 2-epimerase